MRDGCVGRDELERLHAGELDGAREARVGGHLRACAACQRLDAGLIAQHDAMLAELGGSPLTAPRSPQHEQETAAASRSAGEPPSLIGQRVGAYTIQGVIGEGGMGAVYRAQQDKPRQMVALKVIRGGLPSPREMRRFEFESEVLGHLQHIGIARIYQAGLFETPLGQQPYFAMELIDGQPLTAFANKTGLGTRQRLELLARVADAVQHAHSNGIMHLDLKPGNVLVTADGQPKVVDFGLARLAPGQQPPALAGLPLTTILGGTPAYMSPEQAGGDPRAIDARSDVYSLGVVAYELLTGRLPYSSLNSSERGIGPNDVFRIVREEEPTRLARGTRWDGSSARAFAGDVEAIVHKVLEKDKERRYQTAAALAADIRRYLSDQPIAARPASALYQLRKFARRNRGLLGAMLATAAVLVVGLIGTSVGLVRALAAEAGEHAQRQRADRALALESEQRKLADDRADEVQQVADFQAEMLRTINLEQVGRSIRIHYIAELEDELRRVWIQSPGGDLRRRTSHEVDSARRHLAGALHPGNPTDVARGVLRDSILTTSLDKARSRFRSKPTVFLRLLVAIATTYQALGNYGEAECLDREIMQLRIVHKGDRHPDVTSDMLRLASALADQGKYEEAEVLQREAWQRHSAALGSVHRDTASAMYMLAHTLRKMGHCWEAEALYREVLHVAQEQLGDKDVIVAYRMRALANVLGEVAEYAEAESLYRNSLRLFQEHLGGHTDEL